MHFLSWTYWKNPIPDVRLWDYTLHNLIQNSINIMPILIPCHWVVGRAGCSSKYSQSWNQIHVKWILLWGWNTYPNCMIETQQILKLSLEVRGMDCSAHFCQRCHLGSHPSEIPKTRVTHWEVIRSRGGMLIEGMGVSAHFHYCCCLLITSQWVANHRATHWDAIWGVDIRGVNNNFCLLPPPLPLPHIASQWVVYHMGHSLLCNHRWRQHGWWERYFCPFPHWCGLLLWSYFNGSPLGYT